MRPFARRTNGACAAPRRWGHCAAPRRPWRAKGGRMKHTTPAARRAAAMLHPPASASTPSPHTGTTPGVPPPPVPVTRRHVLQQRNRESRCRGAWWGSEGGFKSFVCGQATYPWDISHAHPPPTLTLRSLPGRGQIAVELRASRHGTAPHAYPWPGDRVTCLSARRARTLLGARRSSNGGAPTAAAAQAGRTRCV